MSQLAGYLSGRKNKVDGPATYRTSQFAKRLNNRGR